MTRLRSASSCSTRAATPPSDAPTGPTVNDSRVNVRWGREASEVDAVKVSTRGDYACRALLSLALHRDEQPTSVRDIAERTGLPQPYLEQILLALKGAGLVRSKRGVGGGYVLARDPAETTLAQIVSAVDGPIVVGDFGLPHQDGACEHEGQCILLQVWADVGEHMRSHLESYTLDDMVRRARGNANAPLAPLT